MRLQHQKLWKVFLICLGILFIEAAWLPQLRLCVFAPFLVIAYYSCPFLRCLWLSFSCGILIDLLSSHMHLGIYGLTYYLTTLILFKQRRFFFDDSLSTLALMTALFSALSTGVLTLSLFLLEGGISLSWKWISIDLIAYSGIDALYAFLCFQAAPLLKELWKQKKAAAAAKHSS